METIGDILKKHRERMNVSVEQVQRDTAIRVEQLNWMEQNLFRQFAAPIYAKGHIKAYANYLKIPYGPLIARYKRDFENAQVVTRQIQDKRSKNKKESITKKIASNKRIIFFFGSLSLLSFALVLFISFFQNSLRQPYLQITSPIELAAPYSGSLEVTEDAVVIKGRTEPNTIIQINSFITPINQDFTFESQPIQPTEGGTQIKIEAINSLSIKSSVELAIKKTSEEIKVMNMNITSGILFSDLKVTVDGVLKFEGIVESNKTLSFTGSQLIVVETSNPENFTITLNDNLYNLVNGNIFENLIRRIDQRIQL